MNTPNILGRDITYICDRRKCHYIVAGSAEILRAVSRAGIVGMAGRRSAIKALNLPHEEGLSIYCSHRIRAPRACKKSVYSATSALSQAQEYQPRRKLLNNE